MDQLRDLSEQSGGWCVFERWVALAEWEKMLSDGTADTRWGEAIKTKKKAKRGSDQ